MKNVLFRSLLLLTFFIINRRDSSAQKSPVLNHVAIYVTNLGKSAFFYENIIGLDTIPEPFHDGRHKWFRVARKSHLHIIAGAKALKEIEKNSHMCFSVRSIEKFIQTLDKEGVQYEDLAGKKGAVTTRVDGVKQIYFKDPDGYWIEINNARR